MFPVWSFVFLTVMTPKMQKAILRTDMHSFQNEENTAKITTKLKLD